tara:strand:- start:312 stop:647 length:336 start_codon:yes stop_codon:yes gene_type:complete
VGINGNSPTKTPSKDDQSGKLYTKKAAEAYEWPHFVEVKLEFLEGDSTNMQCNKQYNNQALILLQGQIKMCRTCHRSMPYHHARRLRGKDKAREEVPEKKDQGHVHKLLYH